MACLRVMPKSSKLEARVVGMSLTKGSIGAAERDSPSLVRAAEVLASDVTIGLPRGRSGDHEGEHMGVGAVLEPRRSVQKRHARRAPHAGARPPVPVEQMKDNDNTVFSSGYIDLMDRGRCASRPDF